MKKYLTWIPRVLTIIYILFISLFALDSFTGGFWFGLLGFLIHLIPSFILIVFLLIAWRYKLTGGAIFILLSIIFTIFFRTYEDLIVFLIISLPLLIIGILFIIDYLMSRIKAKH
jgi:hypothetical protein